MSSREVPEGIEDTTTAIDPPHQAMIDQAKLWNRQITRLEDEISGMETTLQNLKQRRDAEAKYLAAIREGIELWKGIKMIGEQNEQ